MADAPEVSTSTPAELLASGRRHLAVRDYSSAVDILAKACESYVSEFGENADECADVYLWYGKALLGLSREESGVLGDGMAGNTNEQDDDDDDDNEEQEACDEANNDAEAKNSEVTDKTESSEAQSEAKAEKTEAESTSKDEAIPETSNREGSSAQAESSGGDNDVAGDESGDDDDENDEDVDNLQLAWEMLELSRNIFRRRVANGASASRNQLSEVHLALGEVALESETYDKACVEMMSCLEIQKELYGDDDRRIAETHYQIGLANSLASNFDEAITHFKNAAEILQSRIKSLENPAQPTDKTIEAEIKEIKELLPEIQDKIQDMMEYKAETIKRMRETLFPSNGSSNGEGSSSSTSSSAFNSNGVSSTSSKPAATNISHLIKRKRKSSTGEEASAPKKAST